MKNSEQLLDYALLLVLFPFFCFVLGSLGFLVGLPLTKWHAVAALALTLGVLKLKKKTWRDWSLAALIFLGLQLGFMAVGSLHTDDSWDGPVYHKAAAILMAEGWNPVWEPDVTKFYERNEIDPTSVRTSHLQYFPKGQWIVCGILYLVTGNIDAGDYVDYIFLCALAVVMYCALREWLGTGKKLALLASFCVAVNPVASGCLANGHIDGLLGNSLIIFLLASACFLKNGSKRWIPWILISALYGCSLKHTAPVYFGVAGVILTVPVLWQVIRSEIGNLSVMTSSATELKSWPRLMIIILFAVPILCANPYVTNTVTHTSPFYPLHSFDEVNHPVEDILGFYYTLDDFRNAGYLRRFVYSYMIGQPGSIVFKTEFDYKFSKIGYIEFSYGLGELNSFGWIFGLALLLSLFLLCFLPFKKLEPWVLLALAATVLIQPHSWWARFVPQIWAFPTLVFLITLANWRGTQFLGSRLKWFTCLLLGALSIQGLVDFSITEFRILTNIQLEQKIEQITKTQSPTLMCACRFVKEHPGEMLFFPKFKYYNSHQIQDMRLPNVSIFQNHNGWQPIPGKPLVYYNSILLCSAKEPVGTYDFDEVELDKKDVSLGKIPSSLLWRLNQRLSQFIHACCNSN